MRGVVMALGGLVLLAGLVALARAEGLLPIGLPGVSAGQGVQLATAGMALMVLSTAIRGR